MDVPWLNETVEMSLAVTMQLVTTFLTGALAVIGSYLWQEKSTFRSLGNYMLLNIFFCYTGNGTVRNIDIPWEIIFNFCDVFFYSSTTVWVSMLFVTACSRFGNSDEVSRTQRFIWKHRRELWNMPIIAGLVTTASTIMCRIVSLRQCLRVNQIEFCSVFVINVAPMAFVSIAYYRTIHRINVNRCKSFLVFLTGELMLLSHLIEHYYTDIMLAFQFTDHFDAWFCFITAVQSASIWILGIYSVVSNLYRNHETEKYMEVLQFTRTTKI